MEMPNPPCNVSDILHFSFQFDNMKKYIDYIVGNEKKLFAAVNEIKKRNESINDLSNKVEGLNTKTGSNKLHAESMNQTIKSQQEFLIKLDIYTKELESKINLLEEEVKSYKSSIPDINKERVEKIEANLENLNILTEKNIKSFEV